MQWLAKRILQDNYSYILYNNKREAIILDCGDFAAVKEYLAEEKLNLKYILVTHCHHDHTNGVKELQELTKAQVVGNKHFTERLPKLDIGVSDLSELDLLQEKVVVHATPGHCADHITYHFPELKLLFVGDVLFSLGCGRVFEGENSTMVDTLNNMKTFPLDTLIFPSHEYTKANLSFVEHLGFFQINEVKQDILKNDMTVPTKLEFELQFNPFLNLNNTDFKQHYNGLPDVDDVSFFTELRSVKNHFTKLVGG